jgi:hypothetical protein
MELEKVYEVIRGRKFFRGVQLKLTLSEMYDAYRKSTLHEKYICYVLCELCEAYQFRWIDFQIGNVSAQFAKQWNEKILNREFTVEMGMLESNGYLSQWNGGTEFDYELFRDENPEKYRVNEYRDWVFEKAMVEFYDVEFNFWVEIDREED